MTASRSWITLAQSSRMSIRIAYRRCTSSSKRDRPRPLPGDNILSQAASQELGVMNEEHMDRTAMRCDRLNSQKP